MILVDRRIRELCKQGMVSPYDPTLLNSHSIDVRIGHTAMVEGLDGNLNNIRLDEHFSRENPYFVCPNQFFLSHTFELVDIPPNIAAEFRLKSTRAREGWTHALAVWIDGGFNGSITLELGNARQYKSLPIYTGMKIGQLIFHETETPDVSYAEVGRYNGYTVVQPAKPDDAEELSPFDLPDDEGGDLEGTPPLTLADQIEQDLTDTERFTTAGIKMKTQETRLNVTEK